MIARAMEEFAAALRACEVVGLSGDRVGRGLGAYRGLFLELASDPKCLNSDGIRFIARKLRQVVVVWRLEQECLAGSHADYLLRYGD